MKAIDSHAHLDIIKPGQPNAEEMLKRAFQGGIEAVVAVAGATTPGDFDATLSLASTHDDVFATAGIHPHGASAANAQTLDKLRRTLVHPQVHALGEIGLDYHYNFSDPKEQRQAFIAQMRIAREKALPVVIHTREADDDTLSILQDEGAQECGGIIHCFSSGNRFAEGAIALGMHLSFSGIVTFPKATEIQEVSKWIPLNRILAETDTPFLSPVPYRGRPNEPLRVVHVIEKLAELRGVTPEEMGEITTENTRNILRLPDL